MNVPPAKTESDELSIEAKLSHESNHQSTGFLEPHTVLSARYEIVQRIGGGGMGAVYLAKDRNLGDAPRAIKEMIQSPMDNAQREKAIADFKRESMLLSSLEHPSIPTIYDYFHDHVKGQFYLVMKYIDGGDLLTRLNQTRGGRLDEKSVAQWASQLADVLDYLHNLQPPIIYRDLKPANLMIDEKNERIMLIDFGIARWVSPQEKGVTAIGTMGYAPPELFGGKAEPRSDIYSLGATMFHLLTGVDPQENPLLIFDFNKNPRPSQINPLISQEMERIVMRAVEEMPEKRFRNCREMHAALLEHLVTLGTGEIARPAVPEALDEIIFKPSADVAASNFHLGNARMVFCGSCGARISTADVFCAYCGARQPLASGVADNSDGNEARAWASIDSANPSSLASHKPTKITARLVVAGTTELDGQFYLNKETNLLGRSDPHTKVFPEVDLSKYDPNAKVSRRHARIWRDGARFLVEDLGSINGTIVNELVRLAPRQPRILESGDKIRLGETTLHFTMAMTTL